MSTRFTQIDHICNIHHFMENSAHHYPDKIALIHDQDRHTYSELNHNANLVAAWLSALSIRRGERIMLLLENSSAYIAGYYGTLKVGAVVTPLNVDIKPETFKLIANKVQPVAVLTSSRFEKDLLTVLRDCRSLKGVLIQKPKLNWQKPHFEISSWEDLPSGKPINLRFKSVQPSELASIIFTSGSTGRPKGVMLSHRNIIANTASIVQYLRLTSADIQMVVLPFYYVMGKSLLNTHVAVGARLVVNNRFAFTASVLREMAEESVTSFSGVPSTYAYLIHRSPLKLYRDKLPHLRYCSQAGGHLSRRLKRELRNLLPDQTQIILMYGATEASARLSYLDSEHFEKKMDSIGKPIPGVSMMIVDAAGEPLGDHQTGEIVGFGDNIMMGYWMDDDATRRAFWRGGYRTGDIGYRDSDGFYYLTGRKDDLIKVSGHRISIREIEEEMMETGLLIEAAVFAVDDDYAGKRICALAVPHDNNLRENDFRKAMANRLPKFKNPAIVSLLKGLPKFSNGKVNRSACLKLIDGLVLGKSAEG